MASAGDGWLRKGSKGSCSSQEGRRPSLQDIRQEGEQSFDLASPPFSPSSLDEPRYKSRWVQSERQSQSSRQSGYRRGMTPTMSGSSSRMGSVGAVTAVARRILLNGNFDLCLGVVILVNCITIGVEQSYRLEGMDVTIFSQLEWGFMAVYTFEVTLRFVGFGMNCLKDAWVRFDCVLVSMGAFTLVLEPMLGQVDELGPLMVLRTARLLRLARSVKLVIIFKDLWMLVRGLQHSVGTMLYTLVLIGIILYIFSCISIELITNNPLNLGPDPDPFFQAHVAEYFSNLPMTMLTLMQFVSFDNVVLVYKPLVIHNGNTRYWFIIPCFFITIMLTVGIVLMNLVTAVIVNSALEEAGKDQALRSHQEESEKKQLVRKLREIFLRLDEDESGEVSRDEIMQCGEEDKKVLNELTAMGDPLEIFNALDVDGSGNVDIEEFCSGVWEVAISKTPIEIKRMEKMITLLRTQVTDILEALRAGRQDEAPRKVSPKASGKSTPSTSRRPSKDSVSIADERNGTPDQNGKSDQNGAAEHNGAAEKQESKVAVTEAEMPNWARELDRSLQEHVQQAVDHLRCELLSAAAVPQPPQSLPSPIHAEGPLKGAPSDTSKLHCARRVELGCVGANVVSAETALSRLEDEDAPAMLRDMGWTMAPITVEAAPDWTKAKVLDVAPDWARELVLEIKELRKQAVVSKGRGRADNGSRSPKASDKNGLATLAEDMPKASDNGSPSPKASDDSEGDDRRRSAGWTDGPASGDRPAERPVIAGGGDRPAERPVIAGGGARMAAAMRAKAAAGQAVAQPQVPQSPLTQVAAEGTPHTPRTLRPEAAAKSKLETGDGRVSNGAAVSPSPANVPAVGRSADGPSEGGNDGAAAQPQPPAKKSTVQRKTRTRKPSKDSDEEADTGGRSSAGRGQGSTVAAAVKPRGTTSSAGSLSGPGLGTGSASLGLASMSLNGNSGNTGSRPGMRWSVLTTGSNA